MNINKQEQRLPVIVHIFYLLAAGTFTYLYYQFIIKPHYFAPTCSVPEVLNFTALKVYQYRILVPYIIKVITLFGLLPQLPIFTLYTWIVIYFTLVVYRLLLKEYFLPDWVSMFLSPLLLYSFFWNYILNNSYFCQFYDFTAILLFVLGLYLIVKEKYNYLLAVFTLAVFNKETSVLLIFAFLFYNYKSVFTKDIIIKTVSLSLIFIIIKSALYFIFIDSPGLFVYNKISFNMNTLYEVVTLQNRIYLKDILTGFGGLYFFVVALVISRKWKIILHSVYPGKLYINFVFIPFIIIGFSFINVEETRVYSELNPLFTTLFIVFLSTFESLGIKMITKKKIEEPKYMHIIKGTHAVIHHN